MRSVKTLAYSLIPIISFASSAYAEGAADAEIALASVSGGWLSKHTAIALAVGIAAVAGTISQGKVASTALDSIGRNPGASGQMFLPFILGLVFIESLVLFTWVMTQIF